MATKEEIFYQYASLNDKNLPIVSFRKFPGDFQGKRPRRSHSRGQFVFPEGGAVKVYASNIYYLVPPKQAIWIPPNIEHEMIFSSQSCPITFSLLDSSMCSNFSVQPSILNVTILVTELLHKSLEYGSNYKKNSPEFRLVNVLLDELKNLRETKLQLPLVKDERLQRVTDLLIKEPASRHDLDHLAKVACMSKRNMTRLFEKETCMKVNEWIRQQKILLAIEKLDKGETVSTISIDLGYKSLSAFIETFKEATGKTPGTFLAK